MKIIFEQTEFNTYEKEEFAQKYFPNYRKSKNDCCDYFEILINDFPIWLQRGITISSDLLYSENKLSKNCKLISGKIPYEDGGNYIVECERIERYEGDIIQRVWLTFLG